MIRVLRCSRSRALASRLSLIHIYGQWVDYIEVGEFAVTDGDIIIGPKDAVREWRIAVERGQQQMEATRKAGKALTLGNANELWLRAASLSLIHI